MDAQQSLQLRLRTPAKFQQIFDMSPDIIRKQIEAITSDMHLDAVKIGMVHSKATGYRLYTKHYEDARPR